MAAAVHDPSEGSSVAMMSMSGAGAAAALALAPHEPAGSSSDHAVELASHPAATAATATAASSVAISIQPASTVAGAEASPSSNSWAGGVGADDTRLSLVYRNLTYTVKDRVTKKDSVIVKGVSGEFAPGRLTALMGASGAGKTSLLNLISGNAHGGTISGEVLVNGEVVTPKLLTSISAFVHQDDVIMDTMTVREALNMSAQLKLPRDMSEQEKLDRVEEVITTLQLRRCAHRIIGSVAQKGISGGERRRVSLGMQMITNPRLLFLDEPTSGLDTYTAFNVVQILKQVAAQGRTVVCTIHQPSSEIFETFDDLLLLADGNVLYNGPAGPATVEYFARAGPQYQCPQYSNPADFIFMRVLNAKPYSTAADASALVRSPTAAALKGAEAEAEAQKDDVEEKQRIAQFLTMWREGAEAKRISGIVANPPRNPSIKLKAQVHEPASFATQFSLLAQRAWNNQFRNPLVTKANFGQTIFMSLLAGLIYLQIDNDQSTVQDRTGALFFVAVNGTMMATMSVLAIFGIEKLVFLREYHAGMYGLPAYFWSRYIVELPTRISFSVISASIMYWMIGFDAVGSKFGLFVIIIILISQAGGAMGILVASIFPDLAVALQIVPIIMMPLMMFAGFFVNSDNIPVYFNWISYIAPMKYGFRAVALNEYTDLVMRCTPDQLVDGICPVTNGNQVLKLMGFGNIGTVGFNIGILAALYAAMMILSYVAMYFTSRKPK